MALKFYNRYNPKPIKDHTSFVGHPEVTNQQASDEVELIKMLNDFAEGNINELPVVREAVYNDVYITPQSFEEAKALIDKVNTDFYSLPKETQRKFGDVNKYVKELSLIAKGDSETLAKYGNFSVVSPDLKENQDVILQASSGISSSSISRGDSDIGSTNLKANNNDSIAGKE